MKTFGMGLAGALVASVLVAGTARAEEMKMSVPLTAAEEVPPNDSAATGTTEVTFDSATRKLSWELEYSGLSGDATAAHFHGPADAGANAPPVVTIADATTGSSGTADLTEAQAAELMAGKWYVNVHTAANPGGEIRGQVKAAP